MDLSNRLFFRHPLFRNSTTSNSGNILISLLSCIFLEIELDTIQANRPNHGARVIYPTVIHRFTTFLGMTALSSRSEVSFLSRGMTQKRRLYLNGERVYESTQKARAKRSFKACHSKSSREIHGKNRSTISNTFAWAQSQTQFSKSKRATCLDLSCAIPQTRNRFFFPNRHRERSLPAGHHTKPAVEL